MCSGSSGFGIGYGIGRKYRPIRVSVSVSDRNQNSGFGRSLLLTSVLKTPQLYCLWAHYSTYLDDLNYDQVDDQQW